MSEPDGSQHHPAESTPTDKAELDKPQDSHRESASDDPENVPAKRSRRSPTRRSPWNTRRDQLIAVALVAICAVTGVVIWAGSDSRATTSETAAAPNSIPETSPVLPSSLKELWQAPSSATPIPITEGATVTTGDGGEVVGRDPKTGAQRWRYARDLPLCTIAAAWSRVLVVHQRDGVRSQRGCGEVTQLDPATGKRTAQRNGDAEIGTRLISDGSHVTTTGERLLNTWRDDLVKSMEYGTVPALVNPNKQPRTGCTYGSVAAGSDKIGVIERCPGDGQDRLTVFKATAESRKDADEPSVVFSSVLPGRRAQVIALAGDLVAVALPEQKLLVTFDSDGTQHMSYPLDVPELDLVQDPPGRVVNASSTDSSIFWFTGSETLALTKTDLSPQWTKKDVLGPTITIAGQLVMPTAQGLAVLDASTGAILRTVEVDRHGYTGSVRLGHTGSVVLEQRGNTLVALG